jgi:hypothetical protein
MKRVDIEFVRRATLALVNGIALGDTVQTRGAAVALAKELGIPQPDAIDQAEDFSGAVRVNINGPALSVPHFGHS